MGELFLELVDAATDACVSGIRRYVVRVRYGGPLTRRLRAAGYRPYERPAQRRLRRMEEGWKALSHWLSRTFSKHKERL